MEVKREALDPSFSPLQRSSITVRTPAVASLNQQRGCPNNPGSLLYATAMRYKQLHEQRSRQTAVLNVQGKSSETHGSSTSAGMYSKRVFVAPISCQAGAQMIMVDKSALTDVDDKAIGEGILRDPNINR
jgi:hypothetical protein